MAESARANVAQLGYPISLSITGDNNDCNLVSGSASATISDGVETQGLSGANAELSAAGITALLPELSGNIFTSVKDSVEDLFLSKATKIFTTGEKAKPAVFYAKTNTVTKNSDTSYNYTLLDSSGLSLHLIGRTYWFSGVYPDKDKSFYAKVTFDFFGFKWEMFEDKDYKVPNLDDIFVDPQNLQASVVVPTSKESSNITSTLSVFSSVTAQPAVAAVKMSGAEFLMNFKQTGDDWDIDPSNVGALRLLNLTGLASAPLTQLPPQSAIELGKGALALAPDNNFTTSDLSGLLTSKYGNIYIGTDPSGDHLIDVYAAANLNAETEEELIRIKKKYELVLVRKDSTYQQNFNEDPSFVGVFGGSKKKKKLSKRPETTNFSIPTLSGTTNTLGGVFVPRSIYKEEEKNICAIHYRGVAVDLSNIGSGTVDVTEQIEGFLGETGQFLVNARMGNLSGVPSNPDKTSSEVLDGHSTGAKDTRVNFGPLTIGLAIPL